MNIIYIVFTAIKIKITFMVCIAHIANAVRSRDSYGGIGSIHIDFAVTEGYIHAGKGFADTGRIIIHFLVCQPGDIAQFTGPIIEETAAVGIGCFKRTISRGQGSGNRPGWS